MMCGVFPGDGMHGVTWNDVQFIRATGYLALLPDGGTFPPFHKILLIMNGLASA